MNEDNVIPIFEHDWARVAHLFSYRERKILESLYGLQGEPQHTINEISRRFGITGERIKQVQTRAVSEIRDLPPEAC